MENKKEGFISGAPPLRVGIDLVAVQRIREILERKEHLEESIFTSNELRYSSEQRDPYISLAALFAVKEAVFKALGTGLSGDMDWREVEVEKEKGLSSAPLLRLCGKTARVADEMGVIRHALSWSQTKEYGMAVVLLIVNSAQKLPSQKDSIPARDSSLP